MTLFDYSHLYANSPLPEDVVQWLVKGDRGVSSETIVSVLWKIPVTSSCSYPYDSGDFGRCHRLMQSCPSVASRLWEMREVNGIWARLVDNWEAMTTLYKAKKYDELNVVLKDCESRGYEDMGYVHEVTRNKYVTSSRWVKA